ncbi:LysR family transcriptional regulator [Rhizobium sp. Rhizsp42]|uniref:LysR family transcriptional regulator n=1 Tax=Rhizobium sp. Rhizsp42 TaxID=3243034 RepID=UPI0039AF78F2
MNLRDLEALVAVVETGSIVSASRRLNLTQPALTRRIQLLEEAVGARLLDRATKPHKATEQGIKAYEHAKGILASVRRLRSELASPAGEIRGEFNLGIMPHLSDAFIERPISHLKETFPHLKIRLTSDWSPALQDKVAARQLDLAIYCLADGDTPPKGISAVEICRTEVVLVASPGLGVPKNATIADLSRFPWVLNGDGCGFRNYIAHTLQNARLPFDVAIEISSSETKMSLVAAGHGIGMIAPDALAECRWKDQLTILDTPNFRPAVRIWASSNPDTLKLISPIDAFLTCIRSLAGEDATNILAA